MKFAVFAGVFTRRREAAFANRRRQSVKSDATVVGGGRFNGKPRTEG